MNIFDAILNTRSYDVVHFLDRTFFSSSTLQNDSFLYLCRSCSFFRSISKSAFFFAYARLNPTIPFSDFFFLFVV